MPGLSHLMERSLFLFLLSIRQIPVFWQLNIPFHVSHTYESMEQILKMALKLFIFHLFADQLQHQTIDIPNVSLKFMLFQHPFGICVMYYIRGKKKSTIVKYARG